MSNIAGLWELVVANAFAYIGIQSARLLASAFAIYSHCP